MLTYYFLSPASQVKPPAIHFPLSGSGITGLAKTLKLSSFHTDYKQTHATVLKKKIEESKENGLHFKPGWCRADDMIVTEDVDKVKQRRTDIFF